MGFWVWASYTWLVYPTSIYASVETTTQQAPIAQALTVELVSSNTWIIVLLAWLGVLTLIIIVILIYLIYVFYQMKRDRQIRQQIANRIGFNNGKSSMVFIIE